MKQEIMQISNIQFTALDGIKIMKDVRQSYVYNDVKRKNPAISQDVLEYVAHRGFILAQLHHHYDFTCDTEIIRPTDVRYTDAVKQIETYEKTIWFVDDADHIQSDDIEQLETIYNFEHDHTLYMYFDEWTQYGYESFLGVDDWQKAKTQVIYEYMRDFLNVRII